MKTQMTSLAARLSRGLISALALVFALPAAPAADSQLGLGDLPYYSSRGPVGTAYLPGPNDRYLVHGGLPRRYLVYIPPTFVPRAHAEVVFMLHGSGGSGEQYFNISGWREQANASGFIVVFPTSAAYILHGKRVPTAKWGEYALLKEIDLPATVRLMPANAPIPANDTDFIEGIIDDLQASFGPKVNPRRIYAAGFSSGAGMTLRLAADLPGRIAAFAGHASFYSDVHPPLGLQRHAPVYLSSGEKDHVWIDAINSTMPPGSPAIGQLPLAPAAIMTTPGLANSLYTFLASLGLNPRAAPTSSAITTFATDVLWSTPAAGNLDGNRAHYSVIAGLDHNYPAGQVNAKNPNGYNVVPRIWAFFQAHALPAP